MNDLPRSTRIVARTIHNDHDVTLHLGASMGFAPGQFIMVWIPGVDEKPFSIAGNDGDGTMITVRRRGPFSESLARLSVGDRVGIRGPYGKPFSLVPDCCLVAGGVGLACVAPIADLYKGAPVLYGENTAGKRLYAERFPHASFYTMDGSAGRLGLPTDDLAAVVRQRSCRMVYCCGPEPMLVKVAEICSTIGVSCQLAVERYMKCGLGVCGQCACGGARVCVDGPVFDSVDLCHISDFGRRRLDATGSWVNAA